MSHQNNNVSDVQDDLLPAATSGGGRWLRTLNVTDAAAHTDRPHCGSIGHVLPFPESCRLAERLGFDAVNADLSYLKAYGPAQTRAMLEQHGLFPAAFAFSAALNACYSDADFENSLDDFEQDLARGREAGFRCCVGYVRPSSGSLDFYRHFRLLVERLQTVKTLLKRHDVRLGLEFIGPTTMRLSRQYDFIHTLDGLRGLIAAAGAESHVGFKLDALHWHTSGAGLIDIEKLSPAEVVYVELNDGIGGDYNRFTLPEFERELPGETGVIDVSGMLSALDALGFDGPVVVEPWNAQLRAMAPETAAEKVKKALDLSMHRAGIKWE